MLALRRGRAPGPGLALALARLPGWPELTVSAYVAVRGELGVLPLPGVRLVLPRVTAGGLVLHEAGGSLRPGQLGIPEPGPDAPVVDPAEVDVFLVPGLAFDRHGGRLGHGKGHYDRLLPRVRGRRVGVCWADQVVDRVPVDPWDVPMDGLVTEAGWVELLRGPAAG